MLAVHPQLLRQSVDSKSSLSSSNVNHFYSMFESITKESNLNMLVYSKQFLRNRLFPKLGTKWNLSHLIGNTPLMSKLMETCFNRNIISISKINLFKKKKKINYACLHRMCLPNLHWNQKLKKSLFGCNNLDFIITINWFIYYYIHHCEVAEHLTTVSVPFLVSWA